MTKVKQLTLLLPLAGLCLAPQPGTSQTLTLQNQDVGFPALPGSLTVTNGKYVVIGGGNDIWGNSDNFHFAWLEVTNDFDYEVQVESLVGPDAWTKAELMAREAADFGTGLIPDGTDRHINSMTTRSAGQNEIALQWRADARGSGSAWPNDIGITAPVVRPTYPNTWLRLMRLGTKFYGLTSTNGVDWVLLRGSPYDPTVPNGTETRPRTEGAFADRLLLGLAVTAHLDTDPTGGVAVFSNFRKHTVVPIAVTAPLPPTVNVPANSPLTLTIGVTGDPVFYQWRKNGTDIPGATSSTLSIPFAQTADAGTYTVRLYGVGQTEVISSGAVVTVTTDSTAPTLVKATPDTTFTTLKVEFSEPVDATAESAANYILSNGGTVSSVLRETPTVVRLTTSRLAEATDYTLTVTGVKDLAGNNIAAGSTLVFKSFAFSPGFSRWERWQDQGDTGNIDTFVNNLANPNFRSPDVTGYTTYFGAPRGASDNYGLRARTWFTAPVSGNYVFFLAADDQAYLYLSTDENPANKKKVAYQPGYSDANQWNDPDTTEVRSDAYSASEWTTGNTITLVAGRRYYMEAVHRDGTGGDGSEVYYKLDTDPDPANGTPSNMTGARIGTYGDPSGASVNITQQPLSVTILDNASAQFSVQATGSVSTLQYQWQRAAASGDFSDIAGATASTYTTPPITMAESGARFRVAITVPGLTQTSQVAVVTVQADQVPPLVTAALRSFPEPTTVTVQFNEVLDPPSANMAANYQINNGINVTAAALGADSRSVVLTTSAINAGTSNTLTINNVKDKAGNLIAANTQVPITFERGVLYVHATAGANASDRLLESRLKSQGYYVEMVEALSSDASMAADKHLIIVSSTVNSGDVTGRFRDSAVPFIVWEQALQDDMAMTSVGGSSDRGTTAGLTSLEIVDATHPLAAGLPAGPVTVVTATSEFAWGQPADTAKKIGRIAGTQNYVIYGYEKGAALKDGTPAPERRVMVFMTDGTPAIFNDNGWRLWDAAVNWAQSIAVVLPPQDIVFNPVTVQPNGTLRLSWTGQGTLQESTNLSAWTDSPNQANPQDVQPTGDRKFFRVRR